MGSGTVYVCDTAQHDSSKIMKLLVRQENANLEILEESALSLATVRRQNCVRVYIIFQESWEWLKEHCYQVWKFVRNFSGQASPFQSAEQVGADKSVRNSKRCSCSVY